MVVFISSHMDSHSLYFSFLLNPNSYFCCVKQKWYSRNKKLVANYVRKVHTELQTQIYASKSLKQREDNKLRENCFVCRVLLSPVHI